MQKILKYCVCSIRVFVGICLAGCDHTGRQKQLVYACADSWPSPERAQAAGGVSGVGARLGVGFVTPS